MQNAFFRRASVLLFFIVFFVGLLYLVLQEPHAIKPAASKNEKATQVKDVSPLSIEAMRNRTYPGSEFVILETLSPGTNYKRYIASYLSDGLKINGLLTVPEGSPPEGGFPAIIFNHGYIPPEEYQTTQRYIAYQDGFSRSGYVTFKSDYRGNGDSEGNPEGAYFSPAYTVDVLNALSSVKKLPYVNKNKIGMWGHSLGGNLTQRALVVDPNDIKAAVIWSGVVGSYEDFFRDWWSKRQPQSFTPSTREINANRPSRQSFIAKYGDPDQKNPFWDSISPTTYLSDIKAPIQLHQGLNDETVPYQLAKDFESELKAAGKTPEVYFYPGNDHNLSQSFDLAMQRSVDFFDTYLKNK